MKTKNQSYFAPLVLASAPGLKAQTFTNLITSNHQKHIDLMRKHLFTMFFGVFLFSGTALLADDGTAYGPWTPVNGWPSLEYYVKRADYNSAAQKYTLVD